MYIIHTTISFIHIFMKSKMTITVDSNVKEEFQRLAKRMGSSTSTLINMYFISAINTGNVRYYDESYSRV